MSKKYEINQATRSIKQPVLELWCGMWFAAAADVETL
jgi:hypothetical protein